MLLPLITASLATMELPAHTRAVFVNIGSNFDPILPPVDDPTISAIAFEPLVYSAITPVNRLYVVPAAVAQEGTMATMHVYDKNKGQSSSLFKPVSNAMFNTTAKTIIPDPTLPVPGIPTKSILSQAELATV